MATSVIKNFIAKALFKKKGAIASSKAVDFSANALEQRLKNIGVDPNAITSENELNQILSAVKQAEDQAFNQNFGNMLGGSKFDRVGEVFDMTGKKLDSSRGTLGGTQIDENTLKEGLMKTDNPFSDLVKTTDQGPKTLAEREAEVLARLEKENKEAAQRIRDRKKLDDPEDMATGGRAGFAMGLGPRFLKLLSENNPAQASKKYLQSVKKRAQEGDMKSLLPEMGAVSAGGIFVNRRMSDVLESMKNQDMENNLENFTKELNADPFYEKYPELKDKMIENYTEKMFGEKKADGGRIGLLAGSVPKVLKFLKNKKKIDEAVNNIFPTGDYKYDAQMAADSLVENNPQIFGGKLYEDLDMDTQMEVYGAVIGPIQNSALSVSRMKKATKPEKTLQSMKEGKGINMSDPEIAEEFSRFMKETDPEGTKKLKQTLELDTFDPTGRKKNADGGRIGLKTGLSHAFIEFLKKFKVKPSGNDLKDFLSKRQFMKDIVGNTEKNKKARQLAEIKEAMENTKGYEFPSGEKLRTDIEKEIAPILLKDRKLNATGGRIGYKDGPKIKIQASGSKTGKNQIEGAPEGITYDSESIDAIIKADIPISQKIDLLADYQYGKGRTRIDNKDQEIYMDEGGYKNRNVGLGFNQDGEGFSGTVMRNLETGDDDFRIRFKKSFADGGRIGLRSGSVDKIRRLILKAFGAGTVGIGAAKSGIFTGLGKGAGKQVAKEVAQQTTSSTPPPYFFKLAEKIKKFGDDVTAKAATKDREVVTKYKDYTLTEDVATGEMTIQRMKVDDNLKYDASEYYGKPVTEDVYMNYKRGKSQMDETTKGKTPPDEYTEDTSLIRSDRPAEGEIMETFDGVPGDVLKEVEDQAPSIKKAGGGIARMLGE